MKVVAEYKVCSDHPHQRKSLRHLIYIWMALIVTSLLFSLIPVGQCKRNGMQRNGG